MTLYTTLSKAAEKVGSRENRFTIQNLIGSGSDNAGDTVYVEKAASEAEWESIFRGSIESLLSTGDYNRHVVAFFAKAGIKA